MININRFLGRRASQATPVNKPTGIILLGAFLVVVDDQLDEYVLPALSYYGSAPRINGAVAYRIQSGVMPFEVTVTSMVIRFRMLGEPDPRTVTVSHGPALPCFLNKNDEAEFRGTILVTGRA